MTFLKRIREFVSYLDWFTIAITLAVIGFIIWTIGELLWAIWSDPITVILAILKFPLTVSFEILKFFSDSSQYIIGYITFVVLIFILSEFLEGPQFGGKPIFWKKKWKDSNKNALKTGGFVDQAPLEAMLRPELRSGHHRLGKDSEGLLSNRLFDATGRRFRQETVRKGPALYRYYVAYITAWEANQPATTITHLIDAATIESVVLGAVRALTSDNCEGNPSTCIERMLASVTVHSDRLTLELSEHAQAAAGSQTIDIGWAQAERGA